jgi:histidinol-phosphatase (PHP family)
MEQTWARAMRIGLPALAFTEHLDLCGWSIDAQDVLTHLRPLIAPDGMLVPPPLDLDGYRDCVERCRRRFPELRILTGVEFGQPHLDDTATHGFDLAGLIGSTARCTRWRSTGSDTSLRRSTGCGRPSGLSSSMWPRFLA